MRPETLVKPEPGIQLARSKDGEKYDDDEIIEISDSDSESTPRSPGRSKSRSDDETAAPSPTSSEAAKAGAVIAPIEENIRFINPGNPKLEPDFTRITICVYRQILKERTLAAGRYIQVKLFVEFILRNRKVWFWATPKYQKQSRSNMYKTLTRSLSRSQTRGSDIFEKGLGAEYKLADVPFLPNFDFVKSDSVLFEGRKVAVGIKRKCRSSRGVASTFGRPSPESESSDDEEDYVAPPRATKVEMSAKSNEESTEVVRPAVVAASSPSASVNKDQELSKSQIKMSFKAPNGMTFEFSGNRQEMVATFQDIQKSGQDEKAPLE